MADEPRKLTRDEGAELTRLNEARIVAARGYFREKRRAGEAWDEGLQAAAKASNEADAEFDIAVRNALPSILHTIAALELEAREAAGKALEDAAEEFERLAAVKEEQATALTMSDETKLRWVDSACSQCGAWPKQACPLSCPVRVCRVVPDLRVSMDEAAAPAPPAALPAAPGVDVEALVDVFGAAVSAHARCEDAGQEHEYALSVDAARDDLLDFIRTALRRPR